MAPIKASLLIAQSVLIWMALTPPSEASQSERRGGTWVARYVKNFVVYLKAAHAAYCAAEVLAIYIPSLSLRTGESSSIDAAFVVGSAAIIGGSALRLICYRHLGRLFTFELSIRSGHKLVTTGPYALVRHPAYTGLFLVLAGELVVQFVAPGSLLYASPYLNSLLKLTYFASVITPIALIYWSLLWRRITLEEKALKEQFGKDWEEWAKSTPYLVLPFVY